MTTNVTTPPAERSKPRPKSSRLEGFLTMTNFRFVDTARQRSHLRTNPARWTALTKHYHSTGINVWKGMLNNEPPSIGKNRMRKL